jgi:outer membrane protein OmpA-like peptidoglycan-associated protein
MLPVVLVASCLAASVAARAADSSTPANNPPAATKTDVAKTDAAAPAAPAPLVVYFDMGSTTIRNEDKAVLDHASRAFNEGKPIVMILTGTADRTGDAAVNLELSQLRASAVLRGLIARGIPADRFQVWPRAKRSCLSPPIPASRRLRTGGSRSPGGDDLEVTTR